MRFERLEIARFGKFSDLTIELPGGGLDFHLVVGPNEAGKSTLRAAIADLLFGIEARSPYAFVHSYDELRLGAAIADGEERREFWRVKRNKRPLRDAQDRPLRDDLLLPFLGEMDRVSYERMFCLDHERLVRGGAEILAARDDLARLLFEASSGIIGFGRLRDALEEEASALYAKRKSGDRLFYRAFAEYQEAERALKEATVRARDWVEVRRSVDEAREARAAATERLAELEAQRARLERIRRVAPHLQRLHEAELERAQLAGTVLLPEDARERLATAEREIAAAQAVLDSSEGGLAEASRRLESIQVDAACLDRAAEIAALDEQRIRTQRLAGDIARREAEARARLEEAQRLARQLGWSGDEESLERMIPPQPVRAAIQELLQDHGRRAEALENARRALADKEVELRALDARLGELPQRTVHPRLRAALAAARALGDVEQRRRELRSRCDQAAERLGRAIERLRPWAGEPQELRTVDSPADAEARDHQEWEKALVARLEAQRDELRRIEEDLAAQRLRAEQLERSRNPVTHDALLEARRQRDALWTWIRAGETTAQAAAQEYEAAVESADRLADQRYAGAADVAALEQAREQIDRLELRRRQAERTAEEIAARIEAGRREWRARLERLGLGDFTAARYLEWSARRAEAIAQLDALSDHEAELRAAAEAEARTADELRRGLETQGIAVPEGGLATLLTHADGLVRDIEKQASEREALAAQRATAAATLATLRQRAEQARADMERWERDWQERLAAARLPPATTRAAAAQALEQFADLAAALRDVRELRRNRIEPMRRDLEAFAAAARALAGSLAPGLEREPPERIALELAERLAAARRAAEERRLASQGVEKYRAEIERARRRRQEAEAALRPLLEQAGVDARADLHAAIERSERLRKLDATVAEARAACIEAGDALAVEQLAAELDAEDVSTLAARLARIESERAEALKERDRLTSEVTAGEAQLARFAGQAAAAGAEARRQEALAAMAGAVERYVKVLVAARLLRWSIDRYREERQGPLLKRAGEIFAILTRGSFERLTVDFEDRTPQLKGCRPQGKLVDVSGMSEGTRDQLYLALRLSALELQLEQGRALPFVADDLFINFDDSRAAAGFEALAELAGQTQVIFLTHHAHLVPIVERTIGRPVNIVRLQ